MLSDSIISLSHHNGEQRLTPDTRSQTSNPAQLMYGTKLTFSSPDSSAAPDSTSSLPNIPTFVSGDSDDFNFSDVELICPINAHDISNRWLNSYIPLPGQQVKNYPASATAFNYRIFKAYTAATIRGRNVPPFVHSSQVTTTLIRPPLAHCLKLVRQCEKTSPSNEKDIVKNLQKEMNCIYDLRETYDHTTLLSAFQAHLIYSMVLFFSLGQGETLFLREAMVKLQSLACSSSLGGLICKAEQDHSRPRWEAWILAEAKRRTLYTMYMFDSLLSAQDGLPTFLGIELKGLPAPGNQLMWKARSRLEWEAECDLHLIDWEKSGLRIDELWPFPADFDEADILERRKRVDVWLENIDEFGTMLYAVTSYIIIMAITTTNRPKASTSPASAEPQSEPYSIFDKRQKAFIVLIVSTAATFSGFASNIYFPAIPSITRDLKVSVELVNLTVTSYLIFQGIAPSLWGPISDVKGRRIAYCCTFLVFFGACIGLANTKNYATLIVLRCLQSTGSASTIAIGSGVIGDITTRAERGGYMGIFQSGLLAPVAIGPVIGGALAGSLGWRSIFWFLAIYAGIFLLLLLLLLPETLRYIVANGSRLPPNPITKRPLSIYQRVTTIAWNPDATPASPEREHIDITGPFRILVSKHAAPIIVFLAIYYAVWQMSITAMSSLFESRYGLSETQIGLTFIANGVGSIIGTLITGKILDKDYRRVKADYEARAPSSDSDIETGSGNGMARTATDDEDKFPLEKARLRLVPIFSAIQCASILLFGWTIQYPDHVPIAIPIMSTFFTGWTAVSTQSVVMTYLVDVFSDRSAAASASLNLARCLFAAGGTSFVMPMVNGMGVGPAFTVCVVGQVGALVGVGVQWRFGGVWRREALRREGGGGLVGG
ncbi:major facilitator superfamily domain-containing protein [Dendryphion nanum]|uniref:Major facilitator superfamily domain-containing protein n=1 Tax=Dendryphion nanum TaxID=256645 RepID=A0A9P9EKD7_9PLEO|nr:major facilitator superfamily domain-containing protein [Dendryphion nanum]